jgi:hypothetical protein
MYGVDNIEFKRYFLMMITESAGCFLPSCVQCCYRTFHLMNKGMDLVEVASLSAAPEASFAGHPTTHHPIV